MQANRRKGGNTVRAGNISDFSGDLNIAGGDITVIRTTADLSAPEIKQLFDQLHAAIRPAPMDRPQNKDKLEAEVRDFHAAVTETVQKKAAVVGSFLAWPSGTSPDSAWHPGDSSGGKENRREGRRGDGYGVVDGIRISQSILNCQPTVKSDF